MSQLRFKRRVSDRSGASDFRQLARAIRTQEELDQVLDHAQACPNAVADMRADLFARLKPFLGFAAVDSSAQGMEQGQ